jgi:small-conductance mechanosensitive channel
MLAQLARGTGRAGGPGGRTPKPLLNAFTDGIYRSPGSWGVAAAKALVTVAVVVAALLVLSVAEDWFAEPCTPEQEADAARCRRRRRAATLSSAALTFGRALVVLAGLVVLLHHAGLRTTTLFTLGSILSLVIGLAAQSMLRDMFAGLMFLSEGQLINGDYVQLVTQGGGGGGSLGAGPGLIGGIVESVNLRRVKLRNFDNELVYVPNAEVRAVVNASQQFPVVRLRLQLSRTSDAAAALAAAQAACAALAADPAFRAFYPAGAAGTDSLRLVRSLDAVGMASPDPELQGVSDVGAGGFEVLVRFMCEVGRQWTAGRYARRALLQSLAPFGPVVQAVRVEGA